MEKYCVVFPLTLKKKKISGEPLGNFNTFPQQLGGYIGIWISPGEVKKQKTNWNGLLRNRVKREELHPNWNVAEGSFILGATWGTHVNQLTVDPLPLWRGMCLEGDINRGNLGACRQHRWNGAACWGRHWSHRGSCSAEDDSEKVSLRRPKATDTPKKEIQMRPLPWRSLWCNAQLSQPFKALLAFVNLLSSLVLAFRVNSSIMKKEGGEMNYREEASPTTGFPVWDWPKRREGKKRTLKNILNIFNDKELDSFFVLNKKQKDCLFISPEW